MLKHQVASRIACVCVCVCTLYRVIQEERSIFWEVTVSFIVRKQFRLNMCLILNGLKRQIFLNLQIKSIANDNKHKSLNVTFILI